MSADLTQPRDVAERKQEIQIVDVRELGEWNAGYIEGSVHLPLDALLHGRMEGIESGKPVIAVCRSGSRSEVAALMLRARGYEAYNLRPGLEGWVDEGLPLTTPDGAPGVVA